MGLHARTATPIQLVLVWQMACESDSSLQRCQTLKALLLLAAACWSAACRPPCTYAFHQIKDPECTGCAFDPGQERVQPTRLCCVCPLLCCLCMGAACKVYGCSIQLALVMPGCLRTSWHAWHMACDSWCPKIGVSAEHSTLGSAVRRLAVGPGRSAFIVPTMRSAHDEVLCVLVVTHLVVLVSASVSLCITVALAARVVSTSL